MGSCISWLAGIATCIGEYFVPNRSLHPHLLWTLIRDHQRQTTHAQVVQAMGYVLWAHMFLMTKCHFETAETRVMQYHLRPFHVDTTYWNGYPYRTDFDPCQGVIVSELLLQIFLGFSVTLPTFWDAPISFPDHVTMFDYIFVFDPEWSRTRVGRINTSWVARI